MKKITVLGLLALSMFTITGCSSNTENTQFVDSGFSICSGSGEPTPWLSTAIKAKRKQESIVNFSVYVGYMSGFIDKWKDDAWLCNPRYGKFSLQRVIRDKNETEISSHYHDLLDFDDESKYLVKVQGTDDGSDKIVSRNFTFNFEDTINLDEITVEQGCILYDICLVDENNQVIVDYLKCGISIGSLYFVKSNNQITFSKYASIFTE